MKVGRHVDGHRQFCQQQPQPPADSTGQCLVAGEAADQTHHTSAKRNTERRVVPCGIARHKTTSSTTQISSRPLTTANPMPPHGLSMNGLAGTGRRRGFVRTSRRSGRTTRRRIRPTGSSTTLVIRSSAPLWRYTTNGAQLGGAPAGRWVSGTTMARAKRWVSVAALTRASGTFGISSQSADSPQEIHKPLTVANHNTRRFRR